VAQALARHPAGRLTAVQTAPSSASQPDRPAAPWAWANRAATKLATSGGKPRGASASGPNAARAADPRRSVKPCRPIFNESSSMVADVTACRTGSPSGARRTDVVQPGPNSAACSVCVTAYVPAWVPGATTSIEARRTLPRIDAASVAIAGRASSATGVGLPKSPWTMASRLSPLPPSPAPRQASVAPVPSVSQAPRRAAIASPSCPSLPGEAAGTQSSGSAGPVDRASTVQSSQSCAGSSGQSDRSPQRAASTDAAGSGGANVSVDVTANEPTGSGTASTSGTATSTVPLASTVLPSTSTHPTARIVGPGPSASTNTALIDAVLTAGMLTVESPTARGTGSRNGTGGLSGSISAHVLPS
jgi:hypothetical protein